jgi:hypothetical protein
MADPAADRFSEDDQQFIKFHGIYQQDDRDLRKTGKKYMMMIRGRIPGGVMTAGAMDHLRRSRDPPRQQHPARHDAPEHPVSRRRDVRARPADQEDQRVAAVHPRGLRRREPQCHGAADARHPAGARAGVMPTACACRRGPRPQDQGLPLHLDRWRAAEPRGSENKDFVDPLYGKTYLPRKFKTAFVMPPVNDMDVFTNDLGFIAIVENDKLLGYNLAVGGGMGRSHGNVQTYPAPRRCHRLPPAGAGPRRRQGRADHPSRFRRPHQPQARPSQIHPRGARRRLDARRARPPRRLPWPVAPLSRSPPRAISTAGTARWTARCSSRSSWRPAASRTCPATR